MNSSISILSALATAVWSVWTWSQEQEKQRQVKRDQEAALYVNSLLAATEDLQSNLYAILAEDGLAAYKEEYQEQQIGSTAAIAFLHCLSQYLGWAHRTFRYGPYTNDPQFITLTRKINKTFESKGIFPGEAFRFTLDERISLGTAVVRRVGESDPAHPDFESLPFYQFLDEIKDEKNRCAALYQSKAVRRAVTAIGRADRAESLEGHERLGVLQNLLVDLLVYLESREGFRVALGERRKVPIAERYALELAEEEAVLVSNAMSSGHAAGSTATIVHQIPGRIRLRIPRVKTDEAYMKRLDTVLGTVESVTGVRITADTASVLVSFTPDIPVAEFAVRLLRAVNSV